jgi:hypothetical protein
MVGGWLEFERKAALPGHEPALLSEDREDRLYFTCESMEELGRMLRNASPEEARARRATFFQPMHQARRRLGQGVHDRAEAYAFAGGELSEYDREGIARHLPLHSRRVCHSRRALRVLHGEVRGRHRLSRVWEK